MSIHRFATTPEPDDINYDFVENVAEALDRSLSAISLARLHSAAQCRETTPDTLATAFEQADTASLPQTLLRSCTQLSDDKVDIEEYLMVLEDLPQDKIIALAQAGILNAGQVFLSVAFSGSADDVRDTWPALMPYVGDDTQSILDRALSLCAYHQELDNGTENNSDDDKIEALIALGADVQADTIWDEVLENGSDDAKIAFVKAGADCGAYLQELQGSSYQSHYIRPLLGTPLYMQIDQNTLAQTVFTEPTAFENRITTYYRFDLGRVVEKHHDGDSINIAQSIAFNDVPVETLEAMHDRLCKLGGTPLPLASSLRTTGTLIPISKRAPAR